MLCFRCLGQDLKWSIRCPSCNRCQKPISLNDVLQNFRKRVRKRACFSLGGLLICRAAWVHRALIFRAISSFSGMGIPSFSSRIILHASQWKMLLLFVLFCCPKFCCYRQCCLKCWRLRWLEGVAWWRVCIKPDLHSSATYNRPVVLILCYIKKKSMLYYLIYNREWKPVLWYWLTELLC